MKYFKTLLLVVLSFGSIASATGITNEFISDVHLVKPSSVQTNKKIKIVYFIPNDVIPFTEVEDRLQVFISFVNKWFNEGDMDFNFDSSGSLDIINVRGNKNRGYYIKQDSQLWGIVTDEVALALKSKDESTSDYLSKNYLLILTHTYDQNNILDIEWIFGNTANSQKFGQNGGVAILNSWFLSDAFSAPTIIDQVQLMSDKNPMTPMGSSRAFMINSSIKSMITHLANALSVSPVYELGPIRSFNQLLQAPTLPPK